MRLAWVCVLLSTPLLADPATFAARRRAVLEKAREGIVLLHANSGFKRWEEAGLLQDPAFLYFTGLRNAQAAILALDGPAKATWLFVRPPFRVGFDPGVLDAVFVSPAPRRRAG
jgi:hypothetical protein